MAGQPGGAGRQARRARTAEGGRAGEIKRLGKDPVIVPLAADGGAHLEVAAPVEDRGRVLGPLEVPAAPSDSPARSGSFTS
jgi:hypothetical protein